LCMEKGVLNYCNSKGKIGFRRMQGSWVKGHSVNLAIKPDCPTTAIKTRTTETNSTGDARAFIQSNPSYNQLFSPAILPYTHTSHKRVLSVLTREFILYTKIV
jgi:hypothetical protein